MAIDSASCTNIYSTHQCVAVLAIHLCDIIDASTVLVIWPYNQMITWAHNPRELVSLSDTICFSISSCQCGPKIDIWRCKPEVKILIGITGKRFHRDARRVVGIDSQSIWYSEALLSLLFGEHKIDAVRRNPMQSTNCIVMRIKERNVLATQTPGKVVR